jgi:hypothetical protein
MVKQRRRNTGCGESTLHCGKMTDGVIDPLTGHA